MSARTVTNERLALAKKIIDSFSAVARNECPSELFVGPTAQEDRKAALIEAFLLAAATLGHLSDWSDERLAGEFTIALRDVNEIFALPARVSPWGSA